MSKYSDNMPPSLRDAIGWMFDHIEENKTFLDFGCSTGYFGSLIKTAKKNKVYGVEISSDISEARKVLDGVYSFDIDAEWPQEAYERKYDYVFFGDVIEHLKDPAKALERCKKLLNKGGTIFISTPNVAHMSVRLQLLGGNFDYEPMGILDNTHLKYFTKKSLTELVAAAGYELESIDYTPNDYPDDVIKKILKKSGLTPNKDFWKLADQPEARAFQWKLIITPANSKPIKPVPAFSSKISSANAEISRNAVMDDLQLQVKNLRQHAVEQAKVIGHLTNEISRIDDLNKRLEYELSRKLITRAKNSIKKVTKKER